MRQQIHPFRRRHYFEPLEPRRLLSLTVPAYNSLPGAPYTIFLEFAGSAPQTWNNNDGHGDYSVHGPQGASYGVPAYNLDSDPNNFSSAELGEIQQIWSWVSEKYSPFDVNVTTVDPGITSNALTDNHGVECVIGGSVNDWYQQQAGGVSAIGGFTSATLPNICWVWSADTTGNTSTTRIHFLGDSVAHEVGHEMGLKHERSNGTATEYYPGTATQAPIMGASSLNTTARGLWWKTNAVTSGQGSTDPVQDELSILYGELGTRPDDHSASAPPVMQLYEYGVFTPESGIIEQTFDTDAYVFTPTVSRVTFSVTDAALGGMLAPNAAIIRRSDAAIMTSTLSTTNTSCSISTSVLVPGTQYELIVYNDNTYGSLGQYNVSGSQQPFATYDTDDRFVNIGGYDGNNNITLSVIPNSPTNANDPGQLLITDSVNGGPLQSVTYPMNGMNFIYITLGSGNDTVTINPTAALNGLPPHPGVQFDGAAERTR